MVTINGKPFICNELRGVKKEIYTQGIRRDKNKKSKAQKLFELYGKELRKKINNDAKLARDIVS